MYDLDTAAGSKCRSASRVRSGSRGPAVSPVLIQLNLQPIQSLNTFELCAPMYRNPAGYRPSYIIDSFEIASARSTQSGLPSAEISNYLLSCLSEHAFSLYGPAGWNTLTVYNRSTSTLK